MSGTQGPTQPLAEILSGNKGSYFVKGIDQVTLELEQREHKVGNSVIDANTKVYTEGLLPNAGVGFFLGTVFDAVAPILAIDVGDVIGTPSSGIDIVPDNDRLNIIFRNNTTLNSFNGANILRRDTFTENIPGTPLSPISQIFAFSIPNTRSPQPKPLFQYPKLQSIP